MKKYFAEGALIVFSVLFALFINKLFTDYQTNQKKEIALESIQKEISKNAEVVEKWKKHHQEINQRISDIVSGKNDNLNNVLKKSDFLHL